MITFKPIPGRPGYDAGDDGVIYRDGRPRRPGSAGVYLNVSFRINGRVKTYSVHKLIALAWYGPCPAGLEVAHLDGNPHNNRPTNLAYVTHAENELHKSRHGTRLTGERHGMAKLTAVQVAAVRRMLSDGRRQIDIAAAYGVTQALISKIKHNELWRESH